ncbi:MAG: hypothetical protein ABW211_00870, partial [Acidimicrobiia bacterium]
MQRCQSLFRLPFLILCLFIVVLTASCGSSDKGLFSGAGTGSSQGGSTASGATGASNGGTGQSGTGGAGTGGMPPPVCPNGVVCNNVCVDTQTSSANCGMCGQACPPRADCAGGLCVCPEDAETACGDKCVDTQISLENCGTCGTT